MSRPIKEVASEIRKYWENVSPYAKPYLDAMRGLNSINDSYHSDSARSVVSYFLANAAAFRGEHARRIKSELKAIVK